jgi:hypothetical protein
LTVIRTAWFATKSVQRVKRQQQIASSVTQRWYLLQFVNANQVKHVHPVITSVMDAPKLQPIVMLVRIRELISQVVIVLRDILMMV